ncbi:MAG TPA: UxaA family hydrolase [Desulfomonilaceae bacterium]|nr:UxaA family hydrolase [Desulfomonilaceae bacterium]
MKVAKIIHDEDNVAIALADVVAGEKVKSRSKGNEFIYTCHQDVPFGHKIAIAEIRSGENIVKYGHPIGSATQDIKPGDWVHIHNVKDDYKVLDKEGKPLPGQGT